jgi:hypothetical protein
VNLMRMTDRILRGVGIAVLVAGTLGALGALLVRDQISRHRRGLFSSSPLQRLAALGYVAGLAASVELVHLLRDFVAWEGNAMLRRRASLILERMEEQLQAANGGAPVQDHVRVG